MKKKLAMIALSAALFSVPVLSVVNAYENQEFISQEQPQTVTDQVYNNSLNAVSLSAASYSIGQDISITGIATREPESSSNVKVTKTGSKVFASNAPESIMKSSQVNQTLYKDNVSGDFRVWASHFNHIGGKLSFYIYFKNPSSNPVNLYKIREANSVGSVTGSAQATTQQFMKLKGTTQKQKPDVTIPAGGSYTLKYGTDLTNAQATNYIGDFKAESIINGRIADASLKVSDIVTNTSSANLDKISNTPTIAPTNHGHKDSDDNYRGLLDYSGRTMNVNLTLNSASPAKWIALSDGYPKNYINEQEQLKSRWDVYGNSQSQTPVVGIISGKKAAAFWFTDYDLEINIINNTGKSNVYSIYGNADGLAANGFINYKIDSLKTYNFKQKYGVVINNRTNYKLNTMVQTGLSLPLGLYFVAK